MVLGGFVRTTTAASLLVLATGLGAVAYSPPPSLVGFFGVLLVGVGFGAFAVTLFAILSAWSPEARPAPDDEPATDRPSGHAAGPTSAPTSSPTEEFVRGGSGGTSAPITAAEQVEVAGSSSPLEALESTLDSDEAGDHAAGASSGDDDQAASRDEAHDDEEVDREEDYEDAEDADEDGHDDAEDAEEDDDDGEDDDEDGDGLEVEEGGFVWPSHRPDDPEPIPDRGRSNGGDEVLDAVGDRAEPDDGWGAASADDGDVREDEEVPTDDEAFGIDDGGMETETEADEDADQGADEDADQGADEDADQGADEDADGDADEDGDQGPDEDDFLWDDPSDR